MKFGTNWYECEHTGDLAMYQRAVSAAGGTVVDSRLNADAEEATIIVEAPDRGEFLKRLGATEMGGFCYQVES